MLELRLHTFVRASPVLKPFTDMRQEVVPQIFLSLALQIRNSCIEVFFTLELAIGMPYPLLLNPAQVRAFLKQN